MCLAPLSSILVYFEKIPDILPFYQFIFFYLYSIGIFKEFNVFIVCSRIYLTALYI